VTPYPPFANRFGLRVACDRHENVRDVVLEEMVEVERRGESTRAVRRKVVVGIIFVSLCQDPVESDYRKNFMAD